MSFTAFIERYQKFCRRKVYDFQPNKPAQIYKELVAILPKDQMIKTLIIPTIEQLNTVSKTVEQLRLQIDQLAAQLPESPVVMAEIGDILRFSHRGALTAFAGVDPGVNQSRKCSQKGVRTSKRGSAQRRKTLFQVMNVLVNSSPEADLFIRSFQGKELKAKLTMSI